MSQSIIIILSIIVLFTGTLYLFRTIQRILYKKNTKNTKTCIYYSYKCIDSIASIFPIFLIIFIVRCFIYEPFQIPSGSMIPSLLIGDFILVKKFSYGIKDPFFHKTLINLHTLPKRGDVIVFKYPLNPDILYIKRIIGLPGDSIIYNEKSKRLTIYNNCKNNFFCKKKLLINYQLENNFSLQENNKIKYIKLKSAIVKQNKFLSNPYCLLEKTFRESIYNRHHHILILDNIIDQKSNYFQQDNNPKGFWVVPKDKYFVMGDNRDNSNDSRYWGFVPKENIIGKATIIWCSLTKQENKWPTGLRFNRIGFIQ